MGRRKRAAGLYVVTRESERQTDRKRTTSTWYSKYNWRLAKLSMWFTDRFWLMFLKFGGDTGGIRSTWTGTQIGKLEDFLLLLTWSISEKGWKPFQCESSALQEDEPPIIHILKFATISRIHSTNKLTGQQNMIFTCSSDATFWLGFLVMLIIQRKELISCNFLWFIWHMHGIILQMCVLCTKISECIYICNLYTSRNSCHM